MFDYKFENSSKLLIISNLIAISSAVIFKWDLSVIVWIYFFESLIIGFFTFLKLGGAALAINLKEGFRLQAFVGGFYAIFFLIHFGGFHFGYFIFLSVLEIFRPAFEQFFEILLFGGVFFISHLYSYIINRKKESLKKIYLHDTFMRPYSRILPMHLTIILGGFITVNSGGDISSTVLVIFMILKTLADFHSHQNKHKFNQRKKEN